MALGCVPSLSTGLPDSVLPAEYTDQRRPDVVSTVWAEARHGGPHHAVSAPRDSYTSSKKVHIHIFMYFCQMNLLRPVSIEEVITIHPMFKLTTLCGRARLNAFLMSLYISGLIVRNKPRGRLEQMSFSP